MSWSCIPRVTDEQIALIRKRRKDGERLKSLAADFNLSVNYVCRVCNLRERTKVKASN